MHAILKGIIKRSWFSVQYTINLLFKRLESDSRSLDLFITSVASHHPGEQAFIPAALFAHEWVSHVYVTVPVAGSS